MRNVQALAGRVPSPALVGEYLYFLASCFECFANILCIFRHECCLPETAATTSPPPSSAVSYSGISTFDGTPTIIAAMAPTTPPSKAVGRLPALG